MGPIEISCSNPYDRHRTRFLALSVPFLLFMFICICDRAYGDVGVVLNDSLDTSVARITGSGHSAVYFSSICPASPIKLRLCRPDEAGSVMSNYTTLGEDRPYEWNIVPLNVYLYGVEDLRNRPIFGSQKIKHVLEERYRKNYLSAYCRSESCRTSDDAEWREMVGAALSRSMYIFVAKTSVQQDLDLIAKFNALPNKNRFNPVTRNCADFTREVVNTYFPHATRPDYINDFGMTSPKAIARSFTRYALHHPDADFRVLHVTQIPGTIKQSSATRTGTEQLFRSKKLLLPMALFAVHELPIVVASYELTGRFNPEHEFEKYPSAAASDDAVRIRPAKQEGDDEQVRQWEASQARQFAEIVGTPQQWKERQKAFQEILTVASQDEIVPDKMNFKKYFSQMDRMGTPQFDRNGELWLELSDGSEKSTVGISAGNIVAPGSDLQLATGLLIARIGIVLKNSKHRRETLPELMDDWNLMLQARSQTATNDATSSDPLLAKILATTSERPISRITQLLP